MPRLRWVVWGLPSALVAVALAGCRSQPRVPVIGYGPELEMQAVARLVLAQIDDSLPGRIRLVAAVPDTYTSTLGDVRAAMSLVSMPGLSAAVGAGSSRGAAATASIYEESRIPVVVPTATSRLMRRLGPWNFALPPDDSVEAVFLSRVARDRFHARQAVLFYVDDEYGTGLRDGLQTALAADSIELTAARPLSQQPGWCLESGPSPTFRLVVRSALHQGRPDVVFAAVRDKSAGCLLNALRAEGVSAPLVAGDGTLLLQELWMYAGHRPGDSLFAAAFWHPELPREQSRRFVRDFVALLGRTPNAGEAMRYDALRILVDAALEVGRDPAAIRQWLGARGHGAPAYPGVTGPIVFGPDREPTFYLVRMIAGAGAPELVP